jgi:hypothetical protein
MNTDANLDEIDFSECLEATRLLDIKDGDDVFVVEVPKELHLAQRSQAKHGVIERRNFLDGHFLTRWFMNCGAGHH